MSDYKPQAWRMAGYYPGQYAKSMAALGIGIDYSDDDHDRYEAQFLADLAEHDAAVKREAAAVALEEAAKVADERAKEYSETAHRLISERAFDDSSRYSNYAAGLTMAAGISRKLATTTRNPRTPGEETTP